MESLPTAYKKMWFPEWVGWELGDLSGHRAMDLGCGDSVMLACIREYGALPFGLDIDGKRVQYAPTVLGLTYLAAHTCRFHASVASVIF